MAQGIGSLDILWDHEHHVVYSMEDFKSITGGYCFYIISEPSMPWGIYGITKIIDRRYCQYLMSEPEALLWKEGVHIYIWKGKRKRIRALETTIKKILRENEEYDDVKTINERGNQVEYFPNEYAEFMVSFVSKTIRSLRASSKYVNTHQK